MTVSRVLRGGHLVRAPLQERVFAAVKKLNYRLNLSARALAGSGPSRVALVYSNPSQAFLSELWRSRLRIWKLIRSASRRITSISPAITTARQPIAEMAQSAIRMLHAASLSTDADANKRTQIVLPCTLIERESSAQPRHKPLQAIQPAGSGTRGRL